MTLYSFRYTITEKDFMEAYEAHWRNNHQSTQFNVLLGVIAILGGSALAYFIGWSGYLLLGVGLVLLVFSALRHYLHVRAFRENRKFRNEIKVVFGEEDIEVKTIDGESRLDWTVYSKCLNTQKFFLLYLSPRVFSIIPKNSLGEHADDFTEFAKRKISQQVAAGNPPG
jgi:hypothetical protein